MLRQALSVRRYLLMYLKTLPLSSGFANPAKKPFLKDYFAFRFACHALPYRVNYRRPVWKLSKGSAPMKKTLLLSLVSLLILAGCNNEESAKDAIVGLKIGNRAPEISGEDIEGVAFKLSDYRGKVVVLDFWGDW